MLFLLLLCVLALPAAGQVSGVVFDEQGAPVAQASVMVYADSLLKPPFLGYAITNGQGRFSIAVSRRRGLWLSVRSVGHAAAAMPLTEEDSVVQVALTNDAHLMDEVLVKGRYSGIKVLGDTIRFDTGYFRTGAEDNLADVLRRLPGVRVEDDGTVTYGNKAVDDVLIDGRKVFDSRDGAAVVGTLSAKHVTGAEIWQNYKPDSMASDKPRSDRQALNVKTDGVKASGSAAMGAGWQDAALADARLMLMRGSASATLRMAANNVRRPTISDTDFQNSLRGTEKWTSDNTSTSNYAAGGGVLTAPPGDSRRARSAAPQLSLNLRPSDRLTLRVAALGNAMSYGTRSVATETYLSDNSRREWGRESHDIYRFGNVSASAKYMASRKLELGAAAVYSHQDARRSATATDSSPGGMNLLDRRRDNANQLHLTTYATARAGRTVTRVYATLLRKSLRETLSLLSDTVLLPLAYATGGDGALPYALGSLRRERLTEGNIDAATDIRLDKRGHKLYGGVEMGVRSSAISDDTASPQAPADRRTDRTAALRVAFGRESMALTYKVGARLWRADASGGGQYAGDGSWYVDPDLSMSLQLHGGHSVSASWQCASRLVDALEAAVGHLAAVGLRAALARAPHAHAHGHLLLFPPALGHVCHAQRLALARQRCAAALHSAARNGEHRVLGRRRAAPLHGGEPLGNERGGASALGGAPFGQRERQQEQLIAQRRGQHEPPPQGGRVALAGEPLPRQLERGTFRAPLGEPHPRHDGSRGERGAAVGRERQGIVCPRRLAGMAEGGLLPRLGGPYAGRGLLAVRRVGLGGAQVGRVGREV